MAGRDCCKLKFEPDGIALGRSSADKSGLRFCLGNEAIEDKGIAGTPSGVRIVWQIVGGPPNMLPVDRPLAGRSLRGLNCGVGVVSLRGNGDDIPDMTDLFPLDKPFVLVLGSERAESMSGTSAVSFADCG